MFDESERNFRCVGLVEDVVFGYMMSDASVQGIENCFLLCKGGFFW